MLALPMQAHAPWHALGQQAAPGPKQRDILNIVRRTKGIIDVKK